jgi:uncharacterized cupredoxin-like copper-binding protein
VSIIYITGKEAPTAVPQDILEEDSPAAPEPPTEPVAEQPDDPIAAAGETDVAMESHPGDDPIASVGEMDAAMDGHSGDAGEGLEVIELEMVEFGYVPDTIDIEAGVPVILRFTNTGKLAHEAMVGDAHMQEEFAAAGDHDGGHGEDDHHGDLMALMVGPGETQDLEVVIDEPGSWFMACHIVGHYEQGQIATINVSA